ARYENTSPYHMEAMRLKEIRIYQEVLDQYRKTLDPNDAGTKRVMEVLRDVEHTYSPFKGQVKDAVSVYGNSFAKPRQNVDGFDVNDYIPNILEYMNITTVAGQ